MIDLFVKNRKLGVWLACYLILCITFAWLINNPPDSAIKLLINRTVAQGQVQEFLEEDALYAITTGTGAPMPDKGRAGSQVIVVAGDQVLAFDSGPGSTLKFELTTINVGELDAVFITHYHSDHIGDLGELMLKRWAFGSSQKPLPIYGPSGIEKVVNGFEAAYQTDKEHRVAHHGEKVMPPSGFGGEPHDFDLGAELSSSKSIYLMGEVEVTAFNVDHRPVFPAVGYRIEYKGRSIVITGDTKYSESLIEHSMGADVLISEALSMKYTGMLADAGRNIEGNLTAIAEDIQTYHISPKQAALVARNAGVSQLVFTHILPPVPTDLLVKPFLNEAREVFNGSMYMAHDGTLITLPVNSRRITLKELLRKGL